LDVGNGVVADQANTVFTHSGLISKQDVEKVEEDSTLPASSVHVERSG
jgi:hypothetical protein